MEKVSEMNLGLQTFDLVSVLVVSLVVLIGIYQYYSNFKSRKPNISKTNNEEFKSMLDPQQKSLAMVSKTGATIGRYSQDAVFVSIPLDLLNEGEYSISELFERITSVRSTEIRAAENSGDTGEKKDSFLESTSSDGGPEQQPDAYDQVILDIDNIQEDTSVLDPENDLEELEELAQKADEYSDDEYEMITKL